MPADLRVAVFRSCSFFKIHRLEDCVLSVLFLNGESCLLDFSLSLHSSVFSFLLFLFCGVVSEEVKLNSAVVYLRSIRYNKDMICYNIHTADKQILVHDPVKQL